NKPELKRDALKPGADPEKEYRKAIADQYATLAMLGFKRSFDMDGIYIPLTVHLDPEAHFIRQVEETGEKLLSRSLKAEDLLKLTNKVAVVLGEPGMGKTTMLHYLARRESKNPNGMLPIFIKLADFCKARQPLELFLLGSVANYITGDAMQNLAKTTMQNGRALILLDGLDEVNREEYNAVTERIRAFIASHRNCRVIITSRKAGFQSYEVPYRIFEIDKLPLAEIETFVNKWFDKKTALAARIEENDRIHELAQNPFLLSIICLIFEKDESLPQRRVELYQKSEVTLLTLFDEKKIPKVNLFTRQERAGVGRCGILLFLPGQR
ncbi:MAG: NACHT domain-containing protein, partial [Candidatus Aminicenantes bacterium]|nr:NACHT domain-containing protein [Candidatus Aminicenantes bacterium]NIQ70980.1 NACHT domain-containing protein [Candidatus Aminicenantes bacterium]NIT27030.1 NACHT domain-containing protein [Candidatus Aminicenantes bacterium]